MTEWSRLEAAGLRETTATRELAAMLDGLGARFLSTSATSVWCLGVDHPSWTEASLGSAQAEALASVDGVEVEVIAADGECVGHLHTAEVGVADLRRAAPRVELWLDRLRERQILDDVSSELIRDHRLLRTRLSDLEEHSDRLQRFAYGVAHELGRPLATMAVTVEAMRLSLPAELPLADTLTERIGDEVDHLQRLVTMLMDVAAVASTAADSDIRDVRLDVERAVTPDAITWSIDPAIELVPAAVAMVLVNLAENAVKYGEATAERPAEISVTADAGMLDLRVADRGPGLGDDVDPGQPFEMFWSDKGGTGVGLAVVDQIVRDAGGTITAGAREGGGLEFHCRLPHRH